MNEWIEKTKRRTDRGMDGRKVGVNLFLFLLHRHHHPPTLSDTFISLRGLLLLTRRFDEAKWIILSFGSAVRHGETTYDYDTITKQLR